MAKNFADYAKVEDTNVLVVDALNLAFRWKHSGAKDFADAYVTTVQSLAKSYKCGKVIIASDWGSSSYRKELAPDYKGNREELRANQSEEEAQAFTDFIEEFERTLGVIETYYPVLRFKKVEADDIAAFICKYKNEYNIEHLWLISTDRDWDLMIDEKTSRFSYINRKETTLATWEHDFPVDQYITYKALTGDKGDNIIGVEGIGPKRATSIIQQYGDIFDIHDQLPLPGKQKFIQNLNANKEKLLLNVELMDLLTYCDEAIGQENCEEIRRVLSEYL